MRLIKCCFQISPLWLAWIMGLVLFNLNAPTNEDLSIPLLAIAALAFPFPVFGLWFYAGARVSSKSGKWTETPEAILTGLGATLIGLGLIFLSVSLASIRLPSGQKFASSYGMLVVFWWTLYTLTYLIFNNLRLRDDLEEMRRQMIGLEQAVRETELEFLRSQLNPHFLFNALNSLATLSLTQPHKAHEMILELSGYLRNGFLRTAQGFITLEKELEATTLYLKIEKMRFVERLQTSFDVDEEALQCRMPQTLLQPIFENAIKYGVSERTEATLIQTRAYLEKDFLMISISNPMPDVVPDKKGKGLGLKNIRQRLEILYQRSDLLDITINEASFHVVLKIPQSPIQHS
ncbi:MAG: sensor histidine kinase [Bacteroidales bacterium]